MVLSQEAQVQCRQYTRLPTQRPPEPNACCGSGSYSSAARTADIRPASDAEQRGKTLVWPLWRVSPFERPSGYDGFTLETDHLRGYFLAALMTGRQDKFEQG